MPSNDLFLQISLMGLTYSLPLIVWLLIYVYLIDAIRAWFQKPQVQRLFQGITGFVLILFGMKLAMEEK